MSSSWLKVAPLLFRPTPRGVSLNAVFAHPDERRRAQLDVDGHVSRGISCGDDAMTWTVDGLEPGTRYTFRLAAGDDVAQGSFVTARAPGASFVFDVLTDSHVFVRDFSDDELARFPLEEAELLEYVAQKRHAEDVLPRVATNVGRDAPDFVVHLGDVIDLHGLGPFNDPPPDASFIAAGFLEYRRLLGDLCVPHFLALGNWDGENGDYPPEAILAARAQRRVYLPNPCATTYPEGGGPNDDYFAWRWGDALFVVLNVMTYTSTSHRLWSAPGRPEDWTLGEDQRRWLRRTLKSADARFKFVFIHHTVGGAGPDPVGAAYGRGGGLAAYVGEQAEVHALMHQYGVQIFFYGHDHVFTDMVIEGIHYTLPGRAGTNWLFPPLSMGYLQAWPDSGHARVEVTPERAAVEFVNLAGDVLHRFEVAPA